MGTKHLAGGLIAVVASMTLAVLAAAQGVQIAPKDTLNIVVSGSTELSRKVTVDADGEFDFPLIGRIKAGGRNTRQVADDLKAKLADGYLVNPTVTVDLEQTLSKHVTIIGQIKVPGSYPFGGELKLIDALAKAGWLADDASDEALIIRAGAPADHTLRLDLYDLMTGASTANNITLQDGDTINIPMAKPVYITGYVRNQGAFPVRRGMTVQQAIALAGGPSEKGKLSGIKIERLGPDGKKLPAIQVKDIKTEIVKPGDTIIVPPRIW
jgi:polysaccharide export outer membrane protein